MFDPGARSTFVFSHPNHELAVFGFMQRLRPGIVYLTDGGGEDRENQTRDGLRRIGLLDQATFFSVTEQSMYEALLQRDTAFFEQVAARLRKVLEAQSPQQVVCDAVEFYNPLHDVALPIVRSATRAMNVRLFEAPLIHQRRAAGEEYVVQRPDASRPPGFSIQLTSEELLAKVQARAEVYTLLVEQMGQVITALPEAHIGRETIVPAGIIGAPSEDVVLRYEWRAERLLSEGQIREPITFEEHYLPVARSLAAS